MVVEQERKFSFILQPSLLSYSSPFSPIHPLWRKERMGIFSSMALHSSIPPLYSIPTFTVTTQNPWHAMGWLEWRRVPKSFPRICLRVVMPYYLFTTPTNKRRKFFFFFPCACYVGVRGISLPSCSSIPNSKQFEWGKREERKFLLSPIVQLKSPRHTVHLHPSSNGVEVEEK